MWACFVVCVAGCAFGVARLHFVEDIGSFFPSNGENQRINDAYQHIGSDNRIIISVQETKTNDDLETVDVELITDVVDELAARLSEADTGHLMKDVFYQVDDEQIAEVTQFVLKNLPYFLEKEDYDRMDSMLSPTFIAQQLESDAFMLASPVGVMQDIIVNDPLFFSSEVLKKLSDFQLDDRVHQENGHLFTKDGNEALLMVSSNFPVSETNNNAKLIQLIDNVIDSVSSIHQGSVEVRSFGASQVSLTNSQQIKKDSIWAIVLSLVFIIALLVYYYRNLKSILLIVSTISFGALMALGLVSFFRNPVSLIAVGVASIIVGIAINYPIHFISHFKRTDDKRLIIKEIVNPLLIGNITTVGAFLSLLCISSHAMGDLGFFAAMLLLGTIAFVLVFLPHFLGKRPDNWKEGELSFKKMAEFHPENSSVFIYVVLLLTVVFFFFSFRTSFETDMHKINYMTEEQRAAFDKWTAQSDTSVQMVYCVAEGKTPEEALTRYELARPLFGKLLADSVVVKVSGISGFIPSQKEQSERIARWNAFWSVRRAQFLADFDAKVAVSGFNPAAFDDFRQLLQTDFSPQPLSYFEPIRKNLASSYIVEEDGKSMIYSVLSVDKKQCKSVETQLSNIDKNVFAFTGSSVISRMVDALSGDFDNVLFICGFIVFAFLLFSFGRIELALSAFVPLTIAWIWILGLMGLFDMKFNIVNIILATFIFGQGDDYTIFVTEGVMYEYAYGKKMLAQFKNSILLSSAIMFLGIGMLIFAKHPAMRSLAEVTIVGMASVVMMAYVFPPLIFKWLTTKKGKKRPIPITLWNLLKTIVSFTVFFIFSIFLSLLAILGIIFFRKNEKMKAGYHRLLCSVFQLFAKWMPQVPFSVDNPTNETFEKPAVVICNHQSHLDLLYTMMLSPKLVVLTNRWVWNCPFYRWIIRYADCLPVTDGMDEVVPKLEKLVKRGYSILVFPEGTRSEDCSILRFHQGAFALADRLHLDIVPVVTHGIGHVFPKAEFVLHKGRVDISILERFSIDNEVFRNGQPALKVASSFRKLYLQAYASLAEKVETPSYFRDGVFSNYLYKGKEVQRICKKNLSDFEKISRAIMALPDTGTVGIRCSGQGEKPLLAALVKKNLQIVAAVSDDELRSLANHCASKPDNLVFIAQLDENQECDVIIDDL